MSEEQTEQDQRLQLVVVTGMSGSGKSTVAKSFEDLGFYCIDNLPLPLLRHFLSQPVENRLDGIDRIALVTDLRARGMASELPGLIETIDRKAVDPTVLFLDTSDQVLVRRYSETRRRHPLASGEDRVIDGIRKERQLLTELRGMADLVLDTTNWTVHEVRDAIYREFGTGANNPGLSVSLLSFGFKHGIPHGADLMFDVRFLPNPYFVPDLRPLTGIDEPIQKFLDGTREWPELLERLQDFVLFLLPQFERENRSYLTIAIGCTGGHHRSVATVERLAKVLGDAGWSINRVHRDILK